MRRLLIAIVPALLVLMLTAMPATAGVQWCRTDPIINFGGSEHFAGTEINLWVSIPEQYESLVNGPVEFTVYVPSDVSREVVYMDPGFNGHGETVAFVDTAWVRGADYQVDVDVLVPFSGDLSGQEIPVLLTIEYPDGQTIDFSGVNGVVSGSFEMDGLSPIER